MSDQAGEPRGQDDGGASGSQGIPPKTDPPAKTPEQMAAEDEKFSVSQCPCEDEEPEAMSEYDVPGEWVTYTGAINQKFFEFASYHAANARREEAVRIQISQSSSEQSSNVPSLELAAPSAPPFEEGAASVAGATTSAGEEHASADNDIATALASVGVHEEAVLEEEDYFYDSDNEVLDDLAVYLAAVEARKAAARSEEAANDAEEARCRADAVAIAGTRYADHLIREYLRIDREAAKVAREAIDAQAKAVRLAQKFQQAKEAARRARASELARASEQASVREQARETEQAQAADKVTEQK